jgi:hypothetical protein
VYWKKVCLYRPSDFFSTNESKQASSIVLWHSELFSVNYDGSKERRKSSEPMFGQNEKCGWEIPELSSRWNFTLDKDMLPLK